MNYPDNISTDVQTILVFYLWKLWVSDLSSFGIFIDF